MRKKIKNLAFLVLIMIHLIDKLVLAQSDLEISWPILKSTNTPDDLSSPFGPRVLNNQYDFHRGIDLVADSLTPIYAVADGEVVVDQSIGSFGNVVIIKHDESYFDDWWSLYAHLSYPAVDEGDDVVRGEFIAYSGNTGGDYAPHLHFSILNKYPPSSTKYNYIEDWALHPTTIMPYDYSRDNYYNVENKFDYAHGTKQKISIPGDVLSLVSVECDQYYFCGFVLNEVLIFDYEEWAHEARSVGILDKDVIYFNRPYANNPMAEVVYDSRVYDPNHPSRPFHDALLFIIIHNFSSSDNYQSIDFEHYWYDYRKSGEQHWLTLLSGRCDYNEPPPFDYWVMNYIGAEDRVLITEGPTEIEQNQLIYQYVVVLDEFHDPGEDPNEIMEWHWQLIAYHESGSVVLHETIHSTPSGEMSNSYVPWVTDLDSFDVSWVRDQDNHVKAAVIVMATDDEYYTHFAKYDVDILAEPDKPIITACYGDNECVKLSYQTAGATNCRIYYDTNSGAPYDGSGADLGPSPIVISGNSALPARPCGS